MEYFTPTQQRVALVEIASYNQKLLALRARRLAQQRLDHAHRLARMAQEDESRQQDGHAREDDHGHGEQHLGFVPQLTEYSDDEDNEIDQIFTPVPYQKAYWLTAKAAQQKKAAQLKQLKAAKAAQQQQQQQQKQKQAPKTLDSVSRVSTSQTSTTTTTTATAVTNTQSQTQSPNATQMQSPTKPRAQQQQPQQEQQQQPSRYQYSYDAHAQPHPTQSHDQPQSQSQSIQPAAATRATPQYKPAAQFHPAYQVGMKPNKKESDSNQFGGPPGLI